MLYLCSAITYAMSPWYVAHNDTTDLKAGDSI